MELIVTTMQGLEEVLLSELKDMGVKSPQVLTRAVKCHGDLKMMYRINYLARTALRVLIPLGEFKILTDKDIYKHFSRIDWEQYFDIRGTFSINTVGVNEFIRNSMYASLIAKDAIVDQFRDKYQKRPNVNPVNPTLNINIHIRRNTMTVSLNSSGESLHQRGYRVHGLDAPLNEVLAAGLVLLSGWAGETPLIDPMCGSGTIGIEAYRIAANIPPQREDRSFDFKKWKNFNAKIWKEVLNEAKANEAEGKPTILLYDKSLQAVRGTQENVQTAEIEGISVSRQDFFKAEGVHDSTVITNPPYDIRLKEDDINKFYQQIAEKLKQDYHDCTAWIFSGNMVALKSMSLKPSKRITLMNGDIESRLYKYEIYEGRRGDKTE
ncbi:MAG TPA: THUMP domain-containing protein [Saprospiraceae bacterium]|nr:methyltransferase [Saprospiraceae bacterium]MCB9327921.1 methyltransferase [Lewinellaceae bacterium]HPK09999.1 THUMP domain-containing protein [Saprospiraceae bacterium]HPQ21911.1 THUMP domain-containing protein [Saprospiraceae bacterium]